MKTARWPWYFYLFLIIGSAMWILFFHSIGAMIWYYLMGGR